MLKARLWVAVCAAPVTIAAALCMTPVSIASARTTLWFVPRELAPDRLMSIARTFEKQGRIADAKKVYEQILAKQSDFAPAQQQLAKIMAAEGGDDRTPSTPALVQKDPRKSPLTEKTPAAVPVHPHPVASLSVEPAFRNEEQPLLRASVKETPPALPQTAVAKATHRPEAPREAVDSHWPAESDAVRNRDDVRDQPTDLDAVTISGNALPERQFVAPSIKPHPVPVRARFKTAPTENQPSPAAMPAEIFSGDAEDQEEFLAPIVRSDARIDSRSPDQDQDVWLSKAAETEEIVELRSLPPAEIAAEAQDSRPIRRELSRSEKLRPFIGATYEQMAAMLQDRREELGPHLVTVATDELYHLQDRSLAVFLLGEFGPEAIDALPRLREAMRETDKTFLQIDLAQTVLLIKPEDAEAVELLLRLLLNTDDTVKWYAAFALRTSASTRTAYVIDELLETLASDNDRLRRMVFLTLGEFGPSATKAVPELQAALMSADPKTRKVAKAVLASIVPEADREADSSIEHDRRSP